MEKGEKTFIIGELNWTAPYNLIGDISTHKKILFLSLLTLIWADQSFADIFSCRYSFLFLSSRVKLSFLAWNTRIEVLKITTTYLKRNRHFMQNTYIYTYILYKDIN